MMNLDKLYGTDQKKEKEGVWHSYGGNLKLKLKRANILVNKEYKAAVLALQAEHEKALKRKALSEEEEREMMMKVFAETVVVDWQGVEDKAGKNIKFTTKNCLECFIEYPQFYLDAAVDADKIEMYMREQEETEKKN